MTELLAKRPLKTQFGTFEELMFDNDVIVLSKGNLRNAENVLCRIHSSCLSGHAFASIECKCLTEMHLAQRLIEKEGKGLIIWLEQEGRGNGHLAVMRTQELKNKGLPQEEAYESLGYSPDARSYSGAAEALMALGVRSIRLLSGNSGKAEKLRKLGIVVDDLVELDAA